MVVAQLVERLRPTQEFRGINQVNSKNFIELLLTTKRRKSRKRGRK